MTIKKITSLTLTDKNGNAGYVDLKQINTNQNDISNLSDRVQKLEDGDFQYAELDFALSINFSKMAIGTYYLVPYTENGKFTNIDSSDLHHFDVLVRNASATKVTKIRTQYVQANIKDVAYTTKENTFQKVNTFTDIVNTNNVLNAAEIATNNIHQKVTSDNADSMGFAKFAITQTDADGMDSAGNAIKTNKDLASIELNTLDGHRKAALAIDDSDAQISIENDGSRVRTSVPIPSTDDGDDDEIATIKNIKEINSRIKNSVSDTSITLQNYPTRDETNTLISNAEQKTLSNVSQEYLSNTAFNDEIITIRSELNEIVDAKLDTSTFNDFVDYNTTSQNDLLAADAINSQAVANTNTRVDEAFNQLANHDSGITTNTNNITTLNDALNNKIIATSDEAEATLENVVYLIY